MSKKLTQKEKAELLDRLLGKGLITKDTLARGIRGEVEPRKLGEFKDTKGNCIEVSTWFDKDNKEYISQTKVLATGVRTKGFAIPYEEFKKYVSLLNSISDKLDK